MVEMVVIVVLLVLPQWAVAELVRFLVEAPEITVYLEVQVAEELTLIVALQQVALV
jgi:hypothetical protein